MLEQTIVIPLTHIEQDVAMVTYRLVAVTSYRVSEFDVLRWIGDPEGSPAAALKERRLADLVALVAEQLDSRPCIFRHEEVGGAGPGERQYEWGYYTLDRKARRRDGAILNVGADGSSHSFNCCDKHCGGCD